jgi:spore germination protein KA
MGIESFLKKLVTYKDPGPYRQFELLEDEESEKGKGPDEEKDGGSRGTGDSPQARNHSQDKGRSAGSPVSGPRRPLSVDEWNSLRNAARQSSPAGSGQQNNTGTGDQGTNSGSSGKDNSGQPITGNLKTDLETIKREMNYPLNQDVVIREFRIMQKYDAFLVFIDGMADNETINDFILRQLMARESHMSGEGSSGTESKKGNDNADTQEKSDVSGEKQDKNDVSGDKQGKSNSAQSKQGKSGGSQGKNDVADVCLVDYILQNLLPANQVVKFPDMDSVIKQVLNGLTAVFVEGSSECIVVETRGYESRSVTTPQTEAVVNGSQEAFVENLRTNLTLIRKIIKSRDLITEIIPIGRVDQINCAIVYMNEIANPKIVEEVKRRINNLDIDFAIGDGVLDQLIEDHPYSIFPQIISTERPDRTASFLINGKVALICDGIPFVSIVPTSFFNMFHTSEDTVMRWQYGTFLRYVRLIASFSAAFLPGLYIALTLYHKEMIPNELMASLHKARENVPFPTVVEVLLMEISFEIIREAGIRVPGVIGQTLGIIGAIVLGQAAVSAGLVSPVLIIIVAITGLGNFTIPNFGLAFAIRILRFLFIFLGAMAGFYGISAGMFVFWGIACSMKSFGVPYFSPVAPKTKSSPDVITRAPIWRQTERPDFLNTLNRKRGGRPVRKWTGAGKGEKR